MSSSTGVCTPLRCSQGARRSPCRPQADAHLEDAEGRGGEERTFKIKQDKTRQGKMKDKKKKSSAMTNR